MTTGVYKLTFPSGNFYIGKSVDIENRWKQHYDKFTKGTHTKNMQREFDLYGTYDQEVIFTCHKDHIDIMEETLIYWNQPTLNGTKGDMRVTVAQEHLEIVFPYFSMSTIEHIAELHNTKGELNDSKDRINELQIAIEELEEQRSDEEISADLENIVHNDKINYEANLTQCKQEYDLEIQAVNEAFATYKALPWYKKIFT